MTAPSPSLLLRLHKLAVGNDENFLTETLAFLLDHLLVQEPPLCLELFNLLTGNLWRLGEEDLPIFEVKTQVGTVEGYPDIQIQGIGHLGFIEGKVEAPLGNRQLERYRKVLKKSGMPNTVLSLLTRYPVEFGENEEKPDVVVRWHEVAQWIEEGIAKPCKDITRYLFRQFLGLLRGRGMTMDTVGWEMPEGVRSLRSLMEMLFEVGSAFQANPWKHYTWDVLSPFQREGLRLPNPFLAANIGFAN